jgi:hypothetical protein
VQSTAHSATASRGEGPAFTRVHGNIVKPGVMDDKRSVRRGAGQRHVAGYGHNSVDHDAPRPVETCRHEERYCVIDARVAVDDEVKGRQYDKN